MMDYICINNTYRFRKWESSLKLRKEKNKEKRKGGKELWVKN